jgi:adenine-specific DNA-methyltransferase
MIAYDLAVRWGTEFGLAWAPLFEGEEPSREGQHDILMDGGFGSFALSVTSEQLWRDRATADWAWSSNVPHHVTVTRSEVAVRRWDRPQAEVFSTSSIDTKLESFYRYLSTDRVRSSRNVVDHVLGLFRRIRSIARLSG